MTTTRQPLHALGMVIRRLCGTARRTKKCRFVAWITSNLMPTKNHELERAHSRTHYHRHKEERIRKAREWHLAHHEEFAQINERYRSQPEVRERHRANVRRQKYESRGAPGYYTEEQLQARIDFYGRRCYLCDC